MEETKKTTTTLEELTETANQKYSQLLGENKLPTLLRAIGLFPDQTISNDVLILSQRPDAICVKRMKEWNYYRRSVKKAEKAIKVISHHIEKYDKDYTDENGNIYTQGIEKLKTDIGYVFDISQTEGKEFNYLNSNKESIAKHFEAAKKALENTAKGFTFEYQNQDDKSSIDWEGKKVTIKDGMSVNEVINELIDNVSKILLTTRNPEGLKNVDEFEQKCVVYAVNSKLGLELPNYDFGIKDLTEEGKEQLKGNLQRVRSVTKQMLSNFEGAIERAIRDLDKKMEEQKEVVKEAEAEQAQPETPAPKKTRSRSKKSEQENEVA